MLIDTKEARRRLDALSRLEQQLTFRISRMAKLLDNHAIQVLADSSVNLTGYRILLVLSIFEETTAADLSRLMVIDRAQISRTVGEMIESGYLADRADPSNRRKKILYLTDAGIAELARVEPHFETRQERLCALLSDDELRGLEASLDKISRHLARELNQPEASPVTVRGGNSD